MELQTHISHRTGIVILAVVAVLIVGVWFAFLRQSPPSTEQPSVDYSAPVVPSYTTPSANPYETAPEVNPVEKTNPFSDLKTNPFE